ncbi:MAG: thiolase family protein [bacterium]
MGKELREVVIVDAVRTPVGRAAKGTLVNCRPDDLGALVVRELVRRIGIDPSLIEDLIIGCAGTEAESGMNVARAVGLLADLPVSVAAITINRYCASGLTAIDQAATNIAFGAGDAIIAGGIESMSMIPTLKGGLNPARTINTAMIEKARGKPAAFNMIQTAQYLYEAYGVTKEEMDKFALDSHLKAIAAIDAGKFKNYIIPVPLKKKIKSDGTISYEYVRIENLDDETCKKLYQVLKEGTQGVDAQSPKPIKDDLYLFDTDECPRRGTSLEKIAGLPPVVQPITDRSKEPVITAGNSSQVNDAAAAALLLSAEKAKELGIKPLAKFISFAVAGVEPYEMGIGPSKAIPKALKRAGLKIEDIDLVEINEAFANVVLTNIKLLKEQGIDIPLEKVNVNGGGVSIGHPLGASGARITADLLYEMKRRGSRYGLASLCVGGGMGEAAIFELIK